MPFLLFEPAVDEKTIYIFFIFQKTISLSFLIRQRHEKDPLIPASVAFFAFRSSQ